MLVTKATGKYGVKIIKGLGDLAIKYPKSAIAGVLYGWFLSDPSGFKEALDSFGGSLEEFFKQIGVVLAETILAVSSGIIDGTVNYAKEHLSIQNIFIISSLLFLFLLYKLKGLLKLFTFFSKKKEVEAEAKRKKEIEPKRNITRKKGRF